MILYRDVAGAKFIWRSMAITGLSAIVRKLRECRRV
jgi:hypothetical protein